MFLKMRIMVLCDELLHVPMLVEVSYSITILLMLLFWRHLCLFFSIISFKLFLIYTQIKIFLGFDIIVYTKIYGTVLSTRDVILNRIWYGIGPDNELFIGICCIVKMTISSLSSTEALVAVRI